MLPSGERMLVVTCEVPIELGKLGIVPECGRGNGRKHYKFFGAWYEFRPTQAFARYVSLSLLELCF